MTTASGSRGVRQGGVAAEETRTGAAPAGGPGAEFAARLQSFGRELDERLREWLAGRAEPLAAGRPVGAELLARLDGYVLRGGKRLRPALLHHAFLACGGVPGPGSWSLAMALELLHAYLLIHDDIMDRSEVRRGGPSAHVDFASLHRRRGWEGDPEHFGLSVAILLGDLANAYVQELAGCAEVPAERRPAVARCFAVMCQEVVVGQYEEMTVPYREQPGEEELLRVLQLKSGRYSVQRPLELGALLAGAPAVTRHGLARYGRLTGEAFQLQDDLLGMFGDAATVGKPVGADLTEGKFTVLIHHALAGADEAGRRLLLAALGNRELDAAAVERVRQVIVGSGAAERVRAMIEERTTAAQAELDGLALTGPGAAFLRGLVAFLRERQR